MKEKTQFQLYDKITTVFDDIFGVPQGRVHETNYDMDDKKDKIAFSSGWMIIKQMDIYSYIRVDIKLKGEESKETKTGKATISISPKLYTEYPQDNIIQQNIFTNLQEECGMKWFMKIQGISLFFREEKYAITLCRT